MEGLPRCQEAAPEALGVADHHIGMALLHRAQHLGGTDRVGGERLLDEQRVALPHGGEHRVDVLVLVGGDDHRGHLGAGEQLLEVAGDEVGGGVGGQRPGDLVVEVAEAEPAERRVLAGQLYADPPDGPAADHRQADARPIGGIRWARHGV